MNKFTVLSGFAAPLPMVNVDTDMIIPKQYLKTVRRTGLGEGLFRELRSDENGNPNADFALNRKPYDSASILIALENFGCGSSREHAPWALLDFGIRCVIAPTFADIFFENCFQNGMLPIVLPRDQVDVLMAAAESGRETFTIDLPAQTITVGNGIPLHFSIDSDRKKCLIEGTDRIAQTMQWEGIIDAHIRSLQAKHPWI